MIPIAIGLGLILNFLAFEMLGISLGGFVVPGFISLEMQHPLSLSLTLLASVLTFMVVRIISNFTVIFGLRQLVIAMLVGFLINEIILVLPPVFHVSNIEGIGYLLPGIIAHWMDRQGAIKTVSTMLIASSLIHLFLIVITGGKFSL